MSEKFAAYINDAYLAWEHRNHKRASMARFAAYLGVKQPTLSTWMTGGAEPDMVSCIKLAKTLGPSVFKAAGQQSPMPDDPIIASVVEMATNMTDAGKLELNDKAVAILAKHRRGSEQTNGESETKSSDT